MSVQEKWVPTPLGQWVQLCEYNEHRQALILQLSDGLAAFGFGTDAPTVTYNGNQLPAGLTQQVGSGSALTSGSCLNPTCLRLSKSRDGDLVFQAWFAWVLSGQSASGGGGGNIRFLTSGSWIVPADVNSIQMAITGPGGDGGSAGGGGGDGGGGGAGAISTYSVVPGQTATVFISGGATTFNWASLTGIQPTNSSEGVLAQPGGIFGVSSTGPRAGGLSGFSIGASKFDGGQAAAGGGGGIFGSLGGGGGGGANAEANTAGNFGLGQIGGTVGGGNGGDQFPSPTPGVNALLGSGGGGGGGGNDAGGTSPQAPGLGDPGSVRIYWTVNSTPLVTVIEAFDTVDPPKAKKMFNVPLPRLSEKAILALQDLLRRVQINPEL